MLINFSLCLSPLQRRRAATSTSAMSSPPQSNLGVAGIIVSCSSPKQRAGVVAYNPEEFAGRSHVNTRQPHMICFVVAYKVSAGPLFAGEIPLDRIVRLILSTSEKGS